MLIQSQGVILTAIVIGISIQALLLVVISYLASIDPVLDVASFESDAHQRGHRNERRPGHALAGARGPLCRGVSRGRGANPGRVALLMCCIATGGIALQTLLSDSTTTLMLLGNHGVVLQLDPRRLVLLLNAVVMVAVRLSCAATANDPPLLPPCCSVASTSASW